MDGSLLFKDGFGIEMFNEPETYYLLEQDTVKQLGMDSELFCTVLK